MSNDQALFYRSYLTIREQFVAARLSLKVTPDRNETFKIMAIMEF